MIHWLIGINVIAGYVLLRNKKWQGWLVMGLNNLLATGYFISNQQWGLVLGSVFNVGIAISAVCTWTRKQPAGEV